VKESKYILVSTLLRELPPRARWYILSVIALGAVVFGLFLTRATFAPLAPLVVLILLSSLTSAFKVQFPIASGSNMSVSYVVDIAALLLRGPDTSMLVSAASGWTQTTLNSKFRNPIYRTLFNVAILILTVQAAGRVYEVLGGRPDAGVETMVVPLTAMALTYFLVNTVPIAVAIALTTSQSAWRVWKSDFLSSAPSYLLGAAVAAVVIQVTQRNGPWMTLILTAAPLYLTYKMYRAGVESEARQGAILEAAHDAILTIDGQLKLREFNPAAENMFGYQRLDVLGKNVEMLLPDADRLRLIAGLTDYLRTGRGPLAGRQIELRGVKADGTEFPVELTVARMGGDRSAELAAFIRDITERHALEEQLRQSQKLEAIGRLAGGVAHDFNNILMSIMGAAELMVLSLKRGDAVTDEADEIKQAVVRGAGLTRQLLAFSRRQATRPQTFVLGDAVHGMESMLRRLIGPEIELTIVSAGDPVSIHADLGQIEQVLLNLVINARDAMPSGGRLVLKVDEVELNDTAAATLAEGRPGAYARLSVGDTGTGMDDTTRARLFEPFFTTKEQGKGTGLGLSIVYGIVKQSSGYITVRSEVGRGTTFFLYFPAVAVGVNEQPAAIAT
jgi:PAS domain S-box-containing protein